ncbi:ABC-type sugar transport system, periplasmic component [Hahella chejuensis KCTC 2396]|uniref:ABC-type sugar transport system, periplasmic component n=2 Tax=Hahella chejuensis TaxID=158327 RepID=Q2SQE8_HAHCH|nr:ABC-type sugar transport system, periplasmic component [Hahella chejuensis KCTC 2396]
MNSNLVRPETMLLKLSCRGAIWLLFWLLASPLTHAAPAPSMTPAMHVVFFNPQSSDDTFWSEVIRFARAAAEDLNIRLDIFSANHDRLLMRQQIKHILASDPPDFIMYKNFKGNAPELLALAEEAKVRSFVFNSGLNVEQERRYGHPRERFKQWIGQMLPNDENAGYALANMLFASASSRELLRGGQVLPILAIGGTPTDNAAIEREMGLHRSLSERPEVELQQLVSARWDEELAYKQAVGLLKRYPRTRVIWAANDSIAVGSLRGAQSLGYKPGENLLIAGIDWSPSALEYIKEGKLAGSYGGHFMQGAWSLVLMYDYHLGRDFADDLGVSIHSNMGLLTPDNVDKYLQFIVGVNWSDIDFTRFSKVLNPQLKQYDFSLERLLQQH